MEDALTVARMDAGDAAEKIHNLEMKLNALEKDKIDEEGVFNAKLEEYISKMNSQQKHAEEALVQLKTKNESLSKRLRKTVWFFISSIYGRLIVPMKMRGLKLGWTRKQLRGLTLNNLGINLRNRLWGPSEFQPTRFHQ